MKKLAAVLLKSGIASLTGAAVMTPVTLIALASIKPPPYFMTIIFAAFLAIALGLFIASGAIYFYLWKFSKRKTIKV